MSGFSVLPKKKKIVEDPRELLFMWVLSTFLGGTTEKGFTFLINFIILIKPFCVKVNNQEKSLYLPPNFCVWEEGHVYVFTDLLMPAFMADNWVLILL